MKLENMFKKTKTSEKEQGTRRIRAKKPEVPKGLLLKMQ